MTPNELETLYLAFYSGCGLLAIIAGIVSPWIAYAIKLKLLGLRSK